VPESSFVLHHDHGKQTHLCLIWLDDEDEIGESFTVVSSRKSRKKATRKVANMSKPMRRSQVKGNIFAQFLADLSGLEGNLTSLNDSWYVEH
jgi:hypothetical protein